MNFPSIDRLPHQLRGKISLEIPSLGEKLSCWIWAGAFAEQRTRSRLYMARHDDAREPRTSGCREKVRGVPMVRTRGKPGPVSAVRVVYAASTGRDYDDVPKLTRCACDRCVSPYHVTETAAPVKTIPERPQDTNPRAVLDMLKNVRPVTECGPGIAAEEIGVAEIPAEIWAGYVQWDADNPDCD